MIYHVKCIAYSLKYIIQHICIHIYTNIYILYVYIRQLPIKSSRFYIFCAILIHSPHQAPAKPVKNTVALPLSPKRRLKGKKVGARVDEDVPNEHGAAAGNSPPAER
ncbi:unnamed protein product [Cladocopium goreaui]|uniref:Uncharacterized protein n=1 Tax=Cladocopium goreaui TaxID=2562237 RepID=A0A9P1G4G2_9DINO|nr:unnamed protein product [Cladocopium goreaui]